MNFWNRVICFFLGCSYEYPSTYSPEHLLNQPCVRCGRPITHKYKNLESKFPVDKR